MIAVPDTAVCVAASELVRRVSEPCLVNHTLRTFAFGAAAGRALGLAFDAELFYLGAALHDLGLTRLASGTQRFEVEGADLAKTFLAEQGVKDADVEVIWDAIALHSTPGVPQRKRAEIFMVQLGAAIDVGVLPREMAGDEIEAILEAFPRLGFKKTFPSYFVEAYRRSNANESPLAALSILGSPPIADVVERTLGVRGPNLFDAIERASFAE